MTKRRLATEWLILLCCCVVGIALAPLITGGLPLWETVIGGILMGPIIYVALGLVRLTLASVRTLASS